MVMFLNDLINFLKPIKVIGNASLFVNRVSDLNIHNSDPDIIMWISKKNAHLIKEIMAGVLICPSIEDVSELNDKCNYLIFDNPRLAFQKVLKLLHSKHQAHKISETAVIHETAVLGQNVNIGHFVIVEEDCTIDNNTSIDHHSIIKKGTKIGKDVKIGAGCVIGGDGFGYEKNEIGVFEQIPHIGCVVICDNVDIGNNTCIDKGVLNTTYIGKHTKIDNLVHIAHGVQIGSNTLIIANAMVAGSVNVGSDAWIAPSASIINGVTIGSDSLIGIGSVVIRDVPNGFKIVGNPGKPLKADQSHD
jgi:UDP-3-O-[3-hydroxymyristoyl] glucosamine N-acyltransferase